MESPNPFFTLPPSQEAQEKLDKSIARFVGIKTKTEDLKAVCEEHEKVTATTTTTTETSCAHQKRKGKRRRN